MKSSGKLWVVATPIGNLADIGARAAEILGQVDLIAAEDTRHSRKLLSHLGVNTGMVALHEHNEQAQAEQLIECLADGQSVALISDAGTPLIADPGYRLVRAAVEAGIVCSPVPGPSALTAALSVAGLPTDRFQFEGFLPTKAVARDKRLAELSALPHTLIFYETPHRIEKALGSIAGQFGEDRQMAVCRELTKRFETVMHGPVGDLLAHVEADRDQRKGEFVLVVAGAPTASSPTAVSANTRDWFLALCEEMPASRAARIAARVSGEPRKAIFALKQ